MKKVLRQIFLVGISVLPIHTYGDDQIYSVANSGSNVSCKAYSITLSPDPLKTYAVSVDSIVYATELSALEASEILKNLVLAGVCKGGVNE